MTKTVQTLVCALVLAAPAVAMAQTPPAATPPAATPAAPAPASPAVAAPAAAAPAPATPAPAVAAAPAPVIVPAPAVVPAPVPVVVASTAEAIEEAAPSVDVEEEAVEPSGLTFSAFVDGHYALSTAKPGASVPGFRAYAGASQAPDGSGYVNDNGFALNFAGLDAAYDGGGYGATVSLRFGPKMGNYHFNSNPGVFGIENVTQAYGTWAPTDALTIDLGMFGTIFGAEVLESWQNLNYSRGALYFAAQPFWHTGLRAGYAVSDAITVTGMVVNDANTTWNTDNTAGNAPSLALQLGISPNEMLSVALGGMVAPVANTESGLETFFDLVVSLSVDDFSAILNADYNFNRGDDESAIMGASLALGYQFVPMLGAALRGEIVSVDDGDDSTEENVLVTGTATLDLKPIADSSNLIIRLEGRVDSQKDAFAKAGAVDETTDAVFMGTLSMVVATN